MSLVKALFDEDEMFRLRMGRYSDRDEHEMKRLVGTHGRDALMRMLGVGVNPRVPAVAGSRPRLGANGTTFGFAHSVIRKETTWRPRAGQIYFNAPKAVASAAGARYDGRAQGPWGRGAYSLPAGRALPAGARPVTPSATGVRIGYSLGTAGAFQAYMERPGAVEERGADARAAGLGQPERGLGQAGDGSV